MKKVVSIGFITLVCFYSLIVILFCGCQGPRDVFFGVKFYGWAMVFAAGQYRGTAETTVTLTNELTTQVTTTDNDGYYQFTNMSAGIYTITPSRANYHFTPPSVMATMEGTANVSVEVFYGDPN